MSTTLFLDREERKPVLWVGGSLAHLGKNPHGKNVYDRNLWRVVWSESREFMFKAIGATKFIWIPMYKNLNCYVLEKWLTPYEFDKTTPEGWEIKNRTMGDLGPYPAQGTYYGPFWEFQDCPTLGAIEKIVGLIVEGYKYSDAQRTEAVIAAAEKEEAIKLNRAKEIILDALPLSVTSGKLSNRFYDDASKRPERYSAQEVGLPTGENKAFTFGRDTGHRP